MRFQALPGFRDFFPAEMATRRWIEQAWHQASRVAGFQEVDGPVLESLELFTAKSGGEISAQLYCFSDKGEREVALRPEMTPTLARMIAARAGGLPKPIKWYSVPQFFRYEKPQRGRGREFFQWNVDIVGAASPAADAEAISVALRALEILGLDSRSLVVRINDRRFVRRVFEQLGVASDLEAQALGCIDKIERDPEARDRLEALVGTERGQQLVAYSDQFPLEQAKELKPVLDACEHFGIGAYIEPDFKIVRGLAYYTGPVWEIFDRGRTLRAVAGGGRYDGLIASLGGPPLEALGFGMGDMVLTELLGEKGLLPEPPTRIEALVIPVGEEMLGAARRVAAQLRRAGVAAEAPYAARAVGKALRAAASAGARRAVLVGPDEWEDDAVVLRDLESGEEKRVAIEQLGSLG